MSAPDAGPQRADIHPAALIAFSLTGAALWIGMFKLLAAACQATAAIIGGW
ncbi:hypothetical protein [Sphingobium sp. Z007]|uniref:hypothetical protein n=1 Tax=Sphingobium sp. Z007 TaxID=627495 RepID=UPI0015961401|nr:hypothetical protein [Sphingobium sp. Z007]